MESRLTDPHTKPTLVPKNVHADPLGRRSPNGYEEWTDIVRQSSHVKATAWGPRRRDEVALYRTLWRLLRHLSVSPLSIATMYCTVACLSTQKHIMQKMKRRMEIMDSSSSFKKMQTLAFVWFRYSCAVHNFVLKLACAIFLRVA
jgi:hypothetical protein